MAWMPDRYRELASLLRRDQVRVDVAEELEHHIEMRTQENMEAGMSREDARSEAMRSFGDFERIRRETEKIDERLLRRRRRRDAVGAFIRESRLAIRSLLRHPSFALVSVATLALGIGAVSAIFAVVDGVILDPLPYPDAEELVWLESPVPYMGPDAAWGLSVAGYFHFKENNRTLASLGAFFTGSTNLSHAAGASRVRLAGVTASIFDVLGARPAAGRLIEETDDVPNPGVVVLGYDFWQREYGGDPDVIGSTIELDSYPYEVIGVVGEGLHLPDRNVDVWRPAGLDPAASAVNAHWLMALARLRDEASLELARDDFGRMTAELPVRFPSAYTDSFMRESGFSTRVVPLREHVVGDVERTLWILLGSVALVLVIAAANVTNLFLVRGEGRRRELAIRSALGADRRDLLWHYLSESLILALAAGAIAIGLAYAAVRLLVAIAPSALPRLGELGLDGSTVAFAALVAVAVGVALGAMPLLHRPVNYGALREGGRGLTPSRRRGAMRSAIVVAQVGLALVLLTAAGLMLRSFAELRSVRPGFDTQNALAMELSLPAARYGGYEETARFYRRLLEEIEALPGVQAAGASEILPLADFGACAGMYFEDRPPDAASEPPCVTKGQATPGYFRALGVPVSGARPDWSDMERRSGGVVVTRALAERVWPGEDPIGKGIRGNGWERPFYRVVGVSDDFRFRGLDRMPAEAVFFPMLPIEGASLWMPPRAMNVVVRTASGDPGSLTASIRRILAELDPTIPLANVRTMETVVDSSPSVARASFTMLLLGVAGGMALLLSGVGLYGLIAYSVGQRRTEIGLRVAIGAGVDKVVRMVVVQSLRLTLFGVVLGVVGALIVTRVMRSLLFGVSPTDPLALSAGVIVLLLVALAATYVPARRAARVDPVEALRAE